MALLLHTKRSDIEPSLETNNFIFHIYYILAINKWKFFSLLFCAYFFVYIWVTSSDGRNQTMKVHEKGRVVSYSTRMIKTERGLVCVYKWRKKLVVCRNYPRRTAEAKERLDEGRENTIQYIYGGIPMWILRLAPKREKDRINIYIQGSAVWLFTKLYPAKSKGSFLFYNRNNDNHCPCLSLCVWQPEKWLNMTLQITLSKCH